MKKDLDWVIQEIHTTRKVLADSESSGNETADEFTFNNGKEEGLVIALKLLDQLDEPETLSQEWIDKYAQGDYDEWVYTEDLQNLLVPKHEEVDRAYRKGFKEGERQTAEYFESITEEPSKEQVWKYLSEHGIEVVDKEPETVADVVADFFKSLERLKEVMSMEVEELEK